MAPEDFDRLVILNLRFHEALAQASRNAFLLDMIKQIHHRVRRFPGTTFTKRGRGALAVDEHRQLIDAIANRDATAARKFATDHMSAARQIRIAMLERERQSN